MTGTFVKIFEQTGNVPVGEKSGDILRKSIYYNKESIYGAFPTFDESVMSFEGVPKVSLINF